MYKKGFFFFVLFVAVALLLGGVVMFLWNAILPEVIAVKALTYPQALGLLVLCRILFGGFGGGAKHRGGGHWREKWANMSEEERMQLKNEWKNRCNPKS